MSTNKSDATFQRLQGRVFLLTFALLAFANTLCIIIGSFHSVDVRAWWPLGLGIGIAISGFYAFVISLLKSLSPQHLVMVNTALAFVLVVHSCLYYLDTPNWLAINNGDAILTPLQSIVFSQYVVYVFYAVFVGIAFVLAYAHRLPRGK
jgi:hypothetical protein